DGDLVVVVDDDEVAELLDAGQGGGLGGHSFLQVAVGGDDVDVVVERAGAGGGVGVEQAPLTPGRVRHPDGRGQSLAERAGGDLHALRVPVLGVTGGLRTPGAQRLDVLQLHVHPGQVELDVLGQRGVAGGEDE